MERNHNKCNGAVIATEQQLETIGITGVPQGALVQLYEINEHETMYGPGSKMKYKYEGFDFIIPMMWVALAR